MQRVISLEKTLGLRKMRAGGEGVTEDEMVGWHHQLNGHEFEQTLGDSEGQGSLVSCSPWGHKELDTTEHLHQAIWLPGRYWVMPEITFGFAVTWRGALLAGT